MNGTSSSSMYSCACWPSGASLYCRDNPSMKDYINRKGM
jgi:hypothetical protein